MMYGSCNMQHDTQNFLSFSLKFIIYWQLFLIFFFFFFFWQFDNFCHFALWTLKIKILKKMKKKNKLGDIIILQIYTINNNHMIYGSWGIERNGQNFMSFQTIFCPFIFLTTQKIKILRKLKKTTAGIIITHTCTINDNHMMYVSWDMELDRQKFLSF